MGPPLQRDLLRRVRTDLLIALVLVLALGGVWAAARLMIAQDERRAVEEAVAETRTLAHLLSLHWSEMVQRIDALQRLARLVTRAQLDGAGNEAALLAELRSSVDIAGSRILQVAGLDATGELVWSTLPMPPGRVNLAQREHVVAIVGEGRDRIVGRPVRGAVSGRWTIQFAEAVRDPDRSLRGITVVSVDCGAAEALARELNILDRGVISIIRSDGVLLARSPNHHLGEVLPAAKTLWPVALRTGAAEGLLPGPRDGVLRFYAERRVAGSDVVVVIGLDAAARLAPVQAAGAQITRAAQALAVALTGLAVAISIGVRRQRSLTQERRRTRDLTQREALLRQMAEQAADVISMQDSGLRNIFVSPAIRSVLGIDPQQLIGHRFGGPALAADLPAIEAALAMLAETGRPQRLTYRASHVDGSFRWMETEMVAVAAAGDRTGCRYVSISRDVTARKQAEEALRQTQQQLETLFRLGPGALYEIVIGPNGEHRLTIPFAAPLNNIGYAPQDLDPAGFSRGIHPADLPVAVDARARCLRAGQAVAEYRFRTPAGDLRWLRDQMRVARLEGECTVLVGYLTDVTAEREARARAERTDRLATLGEVASGIAHEVNQPLAAIAMAAENGSRALARNPPGIAWAEAKFLRIREQAERLGTVIEHIRIFGRRDADRLVAFAPAEVVQNALLLVAARLRSAGAAIVVDLPPDLPRARGAPILLEQVLMNLIVNACDAYAAAGPGAGEACITIAARRDGEAVLLSVADQAGGIAPEVIDRVFDPFFTTKPAGQGTGLGLSISLASITGMGGQIGVRNQGGGAVFEIRLPVAAGAALKLEKLPAEPSH